jgi:hypothetical protein
VTLGKCKKASDLDRELIAVRLRHPAESGVSGRHPEVTPEQRRALIDHELCHAAVHAAIVKYDGRAEARHREFTDR